MYYSNVVELRSCPSEMVDVCNNHPRGYNEPHDCQVQKESFDELVNTCAELQKKGIYCIPLRFYENEKGEIVQYAPYHIFLEEQIPNHPQQYTKGGLFSLEEARNRIKEIREKNQNAAYALFWRSNDGRRYGFIEKFRKHNEKISQNEMWGTFLDDEKLA